VGGGGAMTETYAFREADVAAESEHEPIVWRLRQAVYKEAA